jgi:hypothetical protein
MNRRPLLRVTAVVEVATGVALVVAPSAIVELLLGNGLSAPHSLVLARITGIALVSMGTACWLAANGPGQVGRALIAGMLLYNVGVSILLIHAALFLTIQGIALWPASALHLVLAAWCIASLRTGRD